MASDDPELVARWLAIAGLLATADTMLERGGVAWDRMALIAADTAVEGALGMVAEVGEIDVDDRAGWDEVYSAAISSFAAAGVKVPPSLRARLVRIHRQRNIALHHGSEPAPSAARHAIQAARDLQDLATTAVPSMAPLRGSGPLEAVAQMIDIEAVAGPLSRSAGYLSDGDLTAAADQGAIALDETLRRTTPPLRITESPALQISRLRVREAPASLAPVWQRIDGEIGQVRRKAKRQEAWIIALGIGMRPAELRRLQHTLGTPIRYASGRINVERADDVDLSRDNVEAALNTVADVIFRLWFQDAIVASLER